MEEQDKQISERKERALKIIESPDQYKICEGCDSIVSAHVATCPNCNAYRFECAQEKVVSQAEFLATRERKSVISEDLF